MDNATASSDRATILIVDDTPDNIDLLGEILRPHYKVRVAINGERALAIAKERAPDLILLDVMMPGLSGFEVCEQLKAYLPTRSIPVIFCTAMGEVKDETQGFKVGCVDYITKPVSPPIVLARVQTHLTLYQTERELERKVAERTAEVNETRHAVIRCLGKAAEFKDDQTGYHVLRMAYYTRLLALATGMIEADAELLFQAAPMHDIGKIGVPDAILKKPAKLDQDEWPIMQQHVENGALILGEQKSELLILAKVIALSHHEKWDGTGYPKGLKGEAIPLPGRITAIADVFDALTSVRPYKAAWPMDRVVAHFKSERGKHFDPRLIDLMLPLVPQFEDIRRRYEDAAPH